MHLGVAPHPQRRRDVLAWRVSRTHLLKLSDEDFERLYRGADMHAKAAQWLHAGVCVVAIMRGGAGASLWTREGRADGPASAVTCTRRGPDLPRYGELP